MNKKILIVIIVLLGGCSTKFTYNNLSWLIHWYIDDYVTLSSQQETFFDQNFDSIHHWHRTQELQKYITHLEQLKADINATELSAEKISLHLLTSKQHWERLREKITPVLVSMAKELSDEQLASLYAEFKKQNDKVAKELEKNQALDEDEKMEARIDEIQGEVKSNIGRLSKPQKDIIAQYAVQFSSTRGLWLRYRQDIQNSAHQLLIKRYNNPDFADELSFLLNNPDDFKSEEYQTLSASNANIYAQMSAALFTTLSAKQKNKAINKIEDLIEDFQALQFD